MRKRGNEPLLSLLSFDLCGTSVHFVSNKIISRYVSVCVRADRAARARIHNTSWLAGAFT